MADISKVDYRNSQAYQDLIKEHPDAKVKSFNEETGQIIWTEKAGGATTGGSIWVDNAQSDKEKLEPVFNAMDEMSLENYKAQGFLIPKKNFIDGDYYVFDAKKYEEVTGKSITLGEVKYMLGLNDGVLRETNDIGFKDHTQGEQRDYDTAKLEDVLPSKKIKIPAKALFQNNAERELGLY